MLAEWSIECGADDPVLVVPWTAPGGSGFVDLRENPYDIDHIAEAEQHPAMLDALRALNATRSPVFTAKCDAWPADADELTDLHTELEVAAAEWPHGFVSYIDVLWRERSFFASIHQQEQLLHRLVRYAESIEVDHARLECVLRPAIVDLIGPQQGFAITLYVKALGHEEKAAYDQWAKALEAVVALVRSKDLSFSGAPAQARTLQWT